ncbi:MAG: CHAT domain-containing protein, partial [Novosphingobium sp.]|nr:CHAT domain-containing protein [Novosphingobium sp.]
MRRWYCCLIVALALGSISGCGSARASDSAPFSRESFPIGSSGSACEAQGVALGDARRSIFDRKWVLLCRDIASPVGTAYALRGGVPGLELAQRQRGVTLECAEEGGVEVAGVGLARMRNCRDRETGMAWVIYVFESGRTLFAVEGYAGYDSALRLTLASLVNNAIMPGEVSVATLGTGETTMLTRARAMASDIDSVIGRGYRDNSAGAYVEAAELFASAPALLNAADTQSGDNAARLHEIIVNRALQLSNVGQFDQAAQLFEQARTFATQDPVQARLARNFEAIDALNRGDLEAVEAILARPMPEIAGPSPAEDNTIVIDRVTAAGLNAGNGAALAG